MKDICIDHVALYSYALQQPQQYTFVQCFHLAINFNSQLTHTKMIPEQLKKMFGLKDAKDMNMANNIWKMLDEMSESDPEQYKKFVEKNVKEGLAQSSKKQEEKDKPYKIKPHIGFCLNMTATLNQKPLQAGLNEQVLITKQPWSSVKSKFENSIKATLNVTFSDRIKELKSRSTKKAIDRFFLHELKDIQFFYYSLQGPTQPQKGSSEYEFCMILNSRFYQDLMNQNGGKKILMGLSISFLQERLEADKNPLLRHYNPNEYRRLAFYTIDKYSIEINENVFKYGDHKQPIEFLLEKEVDKKREQQKTQAKNKQAEVKSKKPQIIFRQEKKEQSLLPEIKISPEVGPKKKVLIEVLKEEQAEESNQIAYTMKESQVGYNFQFLLPGVTSIKELHLQMKSDCMILKSLNKKQLTITLKRPINEQTIKAKFKKGQSMLKVEARYT